MIKKYGLHFIIIIVCCLLFTSIFFVKEPEQKTFHSEVTTTKIETVKGKADTTIKYNDIVHVTFIPKDKSDTIIVLPDSSKVEIKKDSLGNIVMRLDLREKETSIFQTDTLKITTNHEVKDSVVVIAAPKYGIGIGIGLTTERTISPMFGVGYKVYKNFAIGIGIGYNKSILATAGIIWTL